MFKLANLPLFFGATGILTLMGYSLLDNLDATVKTQQSSTEIHSANLRLAVLQKKQIDPSLTQTQVVSGERYQLPHHHINKATLPVPGIITHRNPKNPQKIK